jgi:hypothetical protein
MERRAETQGRRRRRSASRSAMARWTRARSSSPVERHGFPASERWPAPSVRVARCMYDRAGGASLRRGRSPRDLCCVALPGTGPVGRARALQPLAGSPVAQRRVERGRAFETEVLRRLGCLHPGAVVIDIEERSERERATVAAMGGGAPIIIAGRLPTDHSGRRAGEPDMLVRAQGSASYRAVDIKAHRSQDDDALAGVEAAWSALAAPGPEVSEARPGLWARKRRNKMLQLAHYQRRLEAAGFAAPQGRQGGILGVVEEVVWYDHLCRSRHKLLCITQRLPSPPPQGRMNASPDIRGWVPLIE